MPVNHFDLPSILHFCIPIDAHSWVSRFESACQFLEAHSRLAAGPLLRVYRHRKDREERLSTRTPYLEDTLKDKYRNLYISSGNGGAREQPRVSLTGFFREPGQAWFDLTIHVRQVEGTLCVELVRELGDRLEAYHAYFTPLRAAQVFSDLSKLVLWPPSAPGRARLETRIAPLLQLQRELGIELPMIQDVAVGGRRASPYQPEELGWINYWSQATCEWLEISPQTYAVFDAIQENRGKATLLRLTQDELDPMRSDHLAKLARVYADLPKLGIRIRHGAQQTAQPAGTEAAQSAPLSFAYIEAGRDRVERALHDSMGQETSSAEQRVNVKPTSHEGVTLETNPAELLAHKSAAGAPLLSEICHRVSACGFLYVAYSETDAVLLEADSKGNYRLSGTLLSQEQTEFCGIPLTDENMLVEFQLVPFAKFDILNFDDYLQLGAGLREQFE